MFKPSQKLASYLNKIKSETGRQVVIVESHDVGLPGMSAAFKADVTSHIVVEIVPNKPTLELEHSIAHEVTHGLLLFARRYCRSAHKHRLNSNDVRNINLLFTMIDDIVVNKIIEAESFGAFAPTYLSTVEKETTAARKGEDYYKMYSSTPLFRNRFMVFRYVMAWGFLKYFDLDSYAQRKLKKFLKKFEKAFPRQAEMANQVKELILRNDIFTPEGHRKTIEGVLKLWKLNDLVELESV